MANLSGPYLVREEEAFVEPGVHSHNRLRRVLSPTQSRGSRLRWVRLALLLLGIAAVGYYGYTMADEYVYQAYENWAFDQQIAGRTSVGFSDYLRQRTPFGFMVGEKQQIRMQAPARPAATAAPSIPEGSVIGRISVARLGLSAIVREGVSASTLREAVGHVPSTAMPGQLGNAAIAAHRDTLFRGLRDIRVGDLVTFQSTGGAFTYRVVATQIVRPSDVSVLRADGGPGFLQKVLERPSKLLTMITCYPFNYIGSAPERFIVQAEELDGSSPPVRNLTMHSVQRRPVREGWHSAARMPRQEAQPKPRKRGFWRRLLSLG